MKNKCAMDNKHKIWLVGALVACLAVVVGCWLLARGFIHFRQEPSTITVTGMAEKEITSDLIVWSLSVVGEADTRSTAFVECEKSVGVVRDYLKQSGIADSCITSGSADVSKLTRNVYDGERGHYVSVDNGYSVSQTLTISSTHLPVVERVYQKISELYGRGINFSSYAPRYYYTRLGDLKKEMLHEAGVNALERATTIAEGCRAEVGDLQKSSMGVFQIVGKHSEEEYSWGGTFNTSSKEKVVSITVKAIYGID